jgi:UPF0042 nucleotide-binding protein
MRCDSNFFTAALIRLTHASVEPAMTENESKGPALRPRLIIVTGVSGSGRASTMRILEDLDFYCVDNLPVALAPDMLRLICERDPSLRGVALGIDARERLFFPEWPKVFSELAAQGFRPEILFLDASDTVLARRYSETRRPHPLERAGGTVAESIRRERLALAEMRERASRVIDTTTLSVHELREIVTAAVIAADYRAQLVVTLVSFGFKYGTPVGLDLMFDVRFLPNPFFVGELRPLDGHDTKVQEFVLGQAQAQRFLNQITGLLEFLLPLYKQEGKRHLAIGFGCTGGRHRSPVLVNEMARRLRAGGYTIQVRDHDIARTQD